MESLLIKSSSTTPEINFETSGNLSIKGISVPENVNQIFSPALSWLEEYYKAPGNTTTLDIALSYFNTSSSKALLTMMLKLSNLSRDKAVDVKVRWFYEEDDQDMFEAGCDYQQIVKVPIELIPVKNLND